VEKVIKLPAPVQTKMFDMSYRLAQYVQAVRDSLEVPQDAVLQRDARGVPVAFVCEEKEANDGRDD